MKNIFVRFSSDTREKVIKLKKQLKERSVSSTVDHLISFKEGVKKLDRKVYEEVIKNLFN